jgi:hypothetical protein
MFPASCRRVYETTRHYAAENRKRNTDDLENSCPQLVSVFVCSDIPQWSLDAFLPRPSHSRPQWQGYASSGCRTWPNIVGTICAKTTYLKFSDLQTGTHIIVQLPSQFQSLIISVSLLCLHSLQFLMPGTCQHKITMRLPNLKTGLNMH